MKKYFLKLSPLLIIIALCACTTENDVGETGAPVYLTVSNIFPASEPFGDIMDDDSGIIPSENVDVEFSNQVKNPDIDRLYEQTVNSTYTDIIVNKYRVYYSRTDGGTVAPDGFEATLNVLVRTNASTTYRNLVILYPDQKAQPPIGFLQRYNLGFEPATNYTSIKCRAFLEFWGETLAGDKVFARGSIEVSFMDYGD